MKDGGPLVSIVTPFLNPGRYFKEAIDSIFSQTWTRWELFLVDDGSTDGSRKIAEACAKRFPSRVFCLGSGHENRGSSAARNLGIERARGELLAFLDADDIWLPQKLERQIHLLKANPEAGMVYGPTIMWNSWREGIEGPKADRTCLLGVEPGQLVRPPRMVELFLKRRAETPGTCSVLARRRLVNEVGAFHHGFRDMYDDQVLFYKFCLKYPVYIESGTWDLYRQHRQSTCHVAARNGFYDPLKGNPAHRLFLEWLENYLACEGIAAPGVGRLLQAALRPYRRPAAHRVVTATRGVRRAFRSATGRILSPRASDASAPL